MKLLRKIVENNPFISEQISGIYVYIVSEEIVDGYEDCTSIESWDNFGKHTNKDYKYIRSKIKQLYLEKGISNLTFVEYQIICKYMASGVGLEYHNNEVFWTDIEQLEFQKDFQNNMKISRNSRNDAVGNYMTEMIFKGYIDQESAETMINEIEQLRTFYLVDGRDGIGFGDNFDGLFNYLLNTSKFEAVIIYNIDINNNKIIVNGDYLNNFSDYLRIRNSTNNDGKYNISSISLVNGNTEIIVIEDILSETTDGELYHSGFKRRSCWTQESQDKLIDIYINGNY